MNKTIQFLKRYSYVFIIAGFIFLTFIRHFALWSPDRSYIFADTTIYALNLVTLAQHITTVFNPKSSIFLWDPYYLSHGLPSLALIDSGFFYPPNWIIAILSRLSSDVFASGIFLYNLSIFIHLAIGAVFVYKLLTDFWGRKFQSALIGAILWVYLGFNTEFIDAAPVLMAATYFPICLYFILRFKQTNVLKYFFAFYIAITLSFLVGYPMVSIIIYVLSVLIHGVWENEIKLIGSVKKFVILHLLGFFLILLPIISPLYLSAAINFHLSDRTVLTVDGFTSAATPFSNIGESLVPANVFNVLAGTYPNTFTFYMFFTLVGVVIILQSKRGFLQSKKNQLWLIIGLLCLVLSLGKITFLPNLIYYLIPGVNLFRRLSVFTIIPGFVFLLFVAQAFDEAVENRSVSSILLFIVKSFLIIFIVAHLLSFYKIDNLNTTYIEEAILYSLIIIAMTLAGIFMYRQYPRLALVAILSVLLIEAGTNISAKQLLQGTVNPYYFYKESSLIKKLQQLVRPTERVDLSKTQYNYKTDQYGLEQTVGYMSLPSNYLITILDTVRQPGYNAHNLNNILGIKYTVTKKSQAAASDTSDDMKVTVPDYADKSTSEYYSFSDADNRWEPDPAGTVYAIGENNDALARLYLASDVQVAPQNKDILQKIPKNDKQTAFVAQKDYINLDLMSRDGTVDLEEYKFNYIRARVDTVGPSYLLNSTGYYPGWWVSINGKLMRPIETNWFMMGTYLPPGESTVEFFYIPYGVIIGGIYLFIAFLFWLVIYFKKDYLTKISSFTSSV